MTPKGRRRAALRGSVAALAAMGPGPLGTRPCLLLLMKSMQAMGVKRTRCHGGATSGLRLHRPCPCCQACCHEFPESHVTFVCVFGRASVVKSDVFSVLPLWLQVSWQMPTLPAVLVGNGFARVAREGRSTSGSEASLLDGRPVFTVVMLAASAILMRLAAVRVADVGMPSRPYGSSHHPVGSRQGLASGRPGGSHRLAGPQSLMSQRVQAQSRPQRTKGASSA